MKAVTNSKVSEHCILGRHTLEATEFSSTGREMGGRPYVYLSSSKQVWQLYMVCECVTVFALTYNHVFKSSMYISHNV